MTTKFLEKYCCPDLANIKLVIFYILLRVVCVLLADCLQKLTLNPSFRVTVIGLSRRLCRTYDMHRNNVGVIFVDWCEELINNSVKVTSHQKSSRIIRRIFRHGYPRERF